MTNLNGNEAVTYSGNSYAGDHPANFTAGGQLINPDFYYNQWPIYYPSVSYITASSRVDQAFKVITRLVESGIITKEMNVKEFIKAVSDIAEVL